MRVLFLFFQFTFGSLLYAQHPIMSEFSGFQSGNSIVLRCTVSKGNQCLGFEVFRSSNAIDFEKIGRIPGVCGDPEIDISYSYVDSQPIDNSINYYKVKPGNYDLSDFIAIEFYNTLKTKYIVLGNSIENNVRIVFNNPSHKVHLLEVFNLQGKLKYISQTTDRFFRIDKQVLEKNFVVFRIMDKNEVVISGKIPLR